MRRVAVALLLATLLTACRTAAPAPRHFWAIAVRDLATADWYVRNFGMTVTQEISSPDGSARVKIVESPAAVVEVQQHRDAVSRQTLRPGIKDFEVHGYFKIGWFVRDLDAELARLQQNGVTIRMRIVEQKQFGIRFFMVADPEGNLIQLFERIPAERAPGA